MDETGDKTARLSAESHDQVRRVAKHKKWGIKQTLAWLISYGLTATNLRKIANGEDGE